ncbi:MAG: hypothetical protein PHQ22_04545 [Sulfuricurvum sp.]|nr:hypothetical protein [Sulfuricurvum sp.]
MNIILTNHALKRLKKRFGIKSKPTAVRYAESIVRGGKSFELEKGCVRYLYLGHSYIFTNTTNTDDEQVLLMLTACNDDKSSEYSVYYQGERKKHSTLKRSRFQRTIA